MSKDLIDYIDWNSISKDYNLQSGDLSLDHTLMLENILEQYIKTNK